MRTEKPGARTSGLRRGLLGLCLMLAGLMGMNLGAASAAPVSLTATIAKVAPGASSRQDSLVAQVDYKKKYKAERSKKRYVAKGWKKKKATKKRYAKKKKYYKKKRYAKKKKYKKKRYVKKKHKAKRKYRVSNKKYKKRPRIAYKKKAKVKKVRVARLSDTATDVSPKKKSLTGGGVRWVASSGCLTSSLRAKVYKVAANYGRVTVSSTCRSKARNRRVGGAKRSQHLTGNAVDFRVHGNWRAAAAYLRGHSGGFKHYGGGLFHLDTGARRRW